jgi:hypothetical protein
VARKDSTPRFERALITGKLTVDEIAAFAEQHLGAAIAKEE